MLSKRFPAWHSRAGQDTDFGPEFIAARKKLPCYNRKIHTIRGNYELWRKRFEKIKAGEAVLSIRQWVGKPYREGSYQKELARLTKYDGIGLQKLGITIVKDKNIGNSISLRIDDNNVSCMKIFRIAENDGLPLVDWCEWIEKYNNTDDLAIIHFTKFRYRKFGML